MEQQPNTLQQQPYQPTHGQQSITNARKSSDSVVFWVTYAFFVIASGAYFINSGIRELQDSVLFVQGGAVAVAVTMLIMLVVWFGILLGIGMFLIRMMRQRMLGNSLLVAYSDYAWLRNWSQQVAADLAMPNVEIYITQDPYMNAYAFGFARPYCIVLNSGSIRYLNDEEIKAIVVHEMAHIKYKHTNAQVFLQPFVSIPIISIFAGWVAGFWSRRAELTADRLSVFYLNNPRVLKNALIKIHVGPDAAEHLNDIAEQWLHAMADKPMNRFAQTFSTHPFLVRRLGWIDSYYATQQPVIPQQSVG